MKSKSCCNRVPPRWATSRGLPRFLLTALACLMTCAYAAAASSDAPAWMHALVNAPLPAHDEKTDAVRLYSETGVTVVSADKIRTQVRRVYKILRPGGREYGTVFVHFRTPGQKVTSLHGWCIPAEGKDYEVKDKEAMEFRCPRSRAAN